MKKGRRKPEWTPEDVEGTFASSIVDGVPGGHDGLPGATPRANPAPGPHPRGLLRADEYIRGVRAGDRVVLARAITLIESNASSHRALAQEVLTAVLPQTGSALRIGVTGVPGGGKSTFIETLGLHLTAHGHAVAVLAVDPTSSVTRGSVLGDKTRMEKLSREPRCFIRPSPSGGTLGGVAGKTRETMLLCEAAGFDVVIVETIGVGQSEIAVRSMVDFFLLLLITGAGDELQGIKKGVMELADAVVVNKADGENVTRANATRAEYAHALHFLAPATEGWTTPVLTCSALTGDGIPGLWQTVLQFREQTSAGGAFAQRRQSQVLEWVHSMIGEHLRGLFHDDPAIHEMMPRIERSVLDGSMTAAMAVQELLRTFEKRHHRTST